MTKMYLQERLGRVNRLVDRKRKVFDGYFSKLDAMMELVENAQFLIDETMLIFEEIEDLERSILGIERVKEKKQKHPQEQPQEQTQERLERSPNRRKKRKIRYNGYVSKIVEEWFTCKDYVQRGTDAEGKNYARVIKRFLGHCEITKGEQIRDLMNDPDLCSKKMHEVCGKSEKSFKTSLGYFFAWFRKVYLEEEN